MDKKDNKKKIIVTGDRPTGSLHIGHYFGSLISRVNMQDEYDQNILIADVQALTDNYNNPEKVRNNVRNLAIDYLSCGIDPEKSTIYIQSMIKEIAELTVFFSNLVTVARLERNPTVKTEISQKKELFGQNGESITYGFLGYPVSQAADITVLKANVIPVGEDQIPVIEQTREIVRKFNSLYTEVFPVPEALVSKNPRVKGLDGNAKMGKSLGNAVFLSDSDEVISKKVMMAVTDKNKIKKDDKANPNVCMVAYYHKLFSLDKKEEIFDECKKGARGCVACKRQLIQNISKFLEPIREKRRYYEKHEKLVDDILISGTKKVQQKAKNTMDEVKEAMKINYFNE